MNCLRQLCSFCKMQSVCFLQAQRGTSRFTADFTITTTRCSHLGWAIAAQRYSSRTHRTLTGDVDCRIWRPPWMWRTMQERFHRPSTEVMQALCLSTPFCKTYGNM